MNTATRDLSLWRLRVHSSVAGDASQAESANVLSTHDFLPFISPGCHCVGIVRVEGILLVGTGDRKTRHSADACCSEEPPVRFERLRDGRALRPRECARLPPTRPPPCERPTAAECIKRRSCPSKFGPPSGCPLLKVIDRTCRQPATDNLGARFFAAWRLKLNSSKYSFFRPNSFGAWKWIGPL